ncbi:hypothetical protein ACET3Z_027642 [Daucus carota]
MNSLAMVSWSCWRCRYGGCVFVEVLACVVELICGNEVGFAVTVEKLWARGRTLMRVGTTVREITRIPVVQNGTAAYLARYGLENMSSFAETPGSFGEKQFMLARDMGLLFDSHPPANFGLGEVIDGEPIKEEVCALHGAPPSADQEMEASFIWRILSLPARLWRVLAK